MSKEFSFVFRDSFNGNTVKVSLDTRVDEWNLFFDRERCILSLFQEFLETFASVESLFCGSVQVGAELGEGSDFSVLG